MDTKNNPAPSADAKEPTAAPVEETARPSDDAEPTPDEKIEEVGGPKGLEPTRFGDWERKGRCIDF